MAKAQRKKQKDIIADYEKRIYDLEQLFDISRSFCETIETSKLMESISFSCMAQMHVTNSGIFVLDLINSENFTLEMQQDDLNYDIKKKCIIPSSDPVIKVLSEEKVPMTLETLLEKCPETGAAELFKSLQPTLIIPLIQKKQINGILYLGERLSLDPDSSSEYTDYEKKLISDIASLAAIAINNATMIERSSTDMMTQLKLKYYFFNALAEKINLAMIEDKSIAVLMFDIDFFKKFNDTYGHECGDFVLKEVAGILRHCLRSDDLASRYGGEEFTVLLYATDKDEAVMIADRIRSSIEKNNFVYNGQILKVTISGGIAVFDPVNNPVMNPKKLVNQADQGLYMSKHNGRNRVTYAHPSLVTDNGEEN